MDEDIVISDSDIVEVCDGLVTLFTYPLVWEMMRLVPHPWNSNRLKLCCENLVLL